MDLKDPLDRELVPSAALATQKGSPLLNAVQERSEEGSEETLDTAAPLLSPFGSVYFVLDQVTTRQMLRAMQEGPNESDQSLRDALSSPTGHLQSALDAMMRGLDGIVDLFGIQHRRQDLRHFVQWLSGTFRSPSCALQLSKEQWEVVVAAILTNAASSHVDVDESRTSLLERNVLAPCGLTAETFRALACVFEETRFVGEAMLLSPDKWETQNGIQ